MQPIYRFGDVVVFCGERRVVVRQQPVAVGARAFDLLVALIERRDRVVGKEELLAVVWPGTIVEEANIQVQASAIRKAIGHDALVTVTGRGYRFSGSLTDVPPSIGETGGPALRDPDRADPLLPDKPSIAVLPFLNLSDDVSHRFLADGVTQDVIAALSRFHSLFVVAHNSTGIYAGGEVDVRAIATELGVRYVVQGSVRRSADRLIVITKLIDGATRRHLWAERYDRVIEEIFTVQEEVTRSIVTAVAPEVASAEIANARRRHPSTLSAYEIALRAWADAWAAFRKTDSVSLEGAFARAEQALALDPESTLALNCIAFLCWQSVFYRSAPSLFDARQRGLESAQRAIELDPSDSLGYVQKGSLLAHAIYDDGVAIPYEEALESLETAVHLNPNDHYALRMLGLTKSVAGFPEQGIEHLLQALRLSPRDPFSVSVFQMLTMSYFAAKKHDEGVRWALRAVAAAPQMANALAYLAQNYVGLGDITQAKAAWMEAHRLAPLFVDAWTGGASVYRRPEDRLRSTTFLRIAAGLEHPAAALRLLG